MNLSLGITVGWLVMNSGVSMDEDGSLSINHPEAGEHGVGLVSDLSSPEMWVRGIGS